MNIVKGFSKFSKQEKIDWLLNEMNVDNSTSEVIKSFWHKDTDLQRILDDFSENTITNYYLPFGIAPNFLINDQLYSIPMVIEESSVVAAASNAAKFWLERGGFKTKILGTKKSGQIHIFWNGESEKLINFFSQVRDRLVEATRPITANMEKRGGGLLDLELINKSEGLSNYYQIQVKFETCDAMGANFINSCLEVIGKEFKFLVESNEFFSPAERELEINMCILSNYTPECSVKTWVECHVDDLDGLCDGLNGREYAEKFKRAVDITKVDPYRATTHNKGIFNGIDSVVLATGNDFRAIEACGHAFASLNGSYQGLSDVDIDGDIFRFSMTIPMAVGTVGGLTKLHPLAKLSLEILGNPSASELMGIISVVGLAQNFAAVRSLTTTGIQQGHMKMHLLNILNSLNASEEEIKQIKALFTDRIVSYNSVRDCVESLRLT